MLKVFKALPNLGNTYSPVINDIRCYMNAVLQCFSHTPLLKYYFSSGAYQHHANDQILSSGKGYLAEVVADFVKEYAETMNVISSLRRLKMAIGRYIPQFQGYDQHDAQEVCTVA